MEAFLVEKPPVANVPKVWQRASNRFMPPNMSRMVSATVKMT